MHARARGEGVRDYFARKGGCSPETSPPLPPMHGPRLPANPNGAPPPQLPLFVPSPPWPESQ